MRVIKKLNDVNLVSSVSFTCPCGKLWEVVTSSLYLDEIRVVHHHHLFCSVFIGSDDLSVVLAGDYLMRSTKRRLDDLQAGGTFGGSYQSCRVPWSE